MRHGPYPFEVVRSRMQREISVLRGECDRLDGTTQELGAALYTGELNWLPPPLVPVPSTSAVRVGVVPGVMFGGVAPGAIGHVPGQAAAESEAMRQDRGDTFVQQAIALRQARAEAPQAARLHPVYLGSSVPLDAPAVQVASGAWSDAMPAAGRDVLCTSNSAKSSSLATRGSERSRGTDSRPTKHRPASRCLARAGANSVATPRLTATPRRVVNSLVDAAEYVGVIGAGGS
mmetsp:Transcript_79297/g.220504  ORF Transcript_79297/g.220504 Transcript_79297/m.220504 type:complete len:232 (+) Transcript_79297:112-807(+)